ncbi:MAG TPA: hypothetical protein DF383_08135, partial [Deltaproteobacteria bacterium]|nr:hypothetical protein [Deltaproteobacteria bacterium]
KRAESEKNNTGDEKKARALKNAENAYRLALQLESNNNGAHKRLIALHYSQGKIDLGRRSIASWVQQASEKDFSAIRDWLQTLPDPAIQKEGAVVFLGKTLVNERRYPEAIHFYENAAAAEAKADPKKAQGYRERAVLIAERRIMGGWENGLKYLAVDTAQALIFKKLQAIRQHIEDGDFLAAQPLLEKLEAASKIFEEAHFQVAPDSEARLETLRLKSTLKLYTAQLHEHENKAAEAKAQYDEVVEMTTQILNPENKPNDEKALLLRAQAYKHLHDFQKARADVRLLSQLSSGSEATKKSLLAAGLDEAKLGESYRESFRSDFEAQLKKFQRFANADTLGEKEQASKSLGKLEKLSKVFYSQDWPFSSEAKCNEDLMLVREFLTLRVQYWESLGLMAFEGQTYKSDAKLQEIETAAKAKEQKAEEHKKYLETIHYSENLAFAKSQLTELDVRLKGQRERLLSSLKSGGECMEARAQLGNIRLAIEIDLVVGMMDYDHIARDFEALQKYTEEVAPRFAKDPEFFFENWQAAWDLSLKLPYGNVVGGVFEPDEVVLKSLRAVLHNPEALKNLQEAYARSEGPPWDQAAFEQLVLQLDGDFDITKLKRLTAFISPEGLQVFFSKNAQAKELMANAEAAASQNDLAASRSLATAALKLYGEIGNAAEMKKTILFIEGKTFRTLSSQGEDEKFGALYDPFWENSAYDPKWQGHKAGEAELKAHYFERAGDMDIKIDDVSYEAWRVRVHERNRDSKKIENIQERDRLEMYWGIAGALKGSSISLPPEDLKKRQEAFRAESQALRAKYPDSRQSTLDPMIGERLLNYEKSDVSFEDWMLEEARLQAQELEYASRNFNSQAIDPMGHKGRIEGDLQSLLTLKN